MSEISHWPDGAIITVAGTGIAGFSGDGGPAIKAQLNWPRDMVVDAHGNLYVADTNNHRIRKVSADGTIGTIVGTGEPGYSGDGGPAASARLRAPRDVEIAPDGTLYIADTGNHCIRKVTPEGIISTPAGAGGSGFDGDNGPAEQAQLSWPQDVSVATDGSVYIADTGNHCIRHVTVYGVIVTIAGTGECAYGGDGAPADRAKLARPRGVLAYADGSVYIADTENHRIRKITPGGTIITVAGNGIEGYTGDGGSAVHAELAWPRGVAVDADGSLYFADCGNSRIRRVTPDGIIETIAGTGMEGYGGDGGPAIFALLADPHGIALTPEGSLLIAEPRSHCIRQVWRVRGKSRRRDDPVGPKSPK